MVDAQAAPVVDDGTGRNHRIRFAVNIIDTDFPKLGGAEKRHCRLFLKFGVGVVTSVKQGAGGPAAIGVEHHLHSRDRSNFERDRRGVITY